MDIEKYMTWPIKKLAEWAKISYSGEFRNACAAHIGWGWALMLTLLKLWWPLSFVCVAYPILREAQDSEWFKKWNRKSWVDLFTFEAGNLVGFLCSFL